MLPLKEFAYFVTLNTADLAETYIQLLQKTGQGYEQISPDSCRASARKLLEAIAEACQAETFNPLSQLFDPDKNASQRWAGFQILPHQPFFEVECLGRTLTPVVTSLEAGKFLWQMLAEVRAIILAATEKLSATSTISSSPGPVSSAQLTEQARQVEPSIQESLDHFKGAFEYAASGMMIVSKEGRFLLVNDALCRMLGYSKQEMLSINFQAITHPADLAGNVNRLRQLLAGELDSFQEEKRYVHKLGPVIWVQINVAAVRDGEGGILYFVTQVYDITQRRQTEEMLQRLRLAVEQSLDGLAITDLDGLVQFVNPAWAAMHGYSVEELAGQPLSLFHTAEQLRTEVELFQAQVIEKGLRQGEVGHKRKDGSTFPTWMSVTQINDTAGNPIGLLAVCQDITGRKQVGEALAKRADELQAVTRISVALSSILDSERLLQEVVDLTKSGFDLYHAHLYLLDETGQDLVLAVGAGDVGRKMTAQGWSIPVMHEKSLVARTARTRQGVISNDVRAEPDFLPNPDLPETRSEMAIPLLAGEKLLGVLDVQSDRVGRFTEEDVQIVTTLAAQAATAIQNARLFTQTQAALTDLSESQNLLKSIIDATPDWIFIKDQEHRYRLVNQGYANSLHLPPEDFIGKNDLDIGFPEDIIKGNPDKGIRGFWADDREVMDSGSPKFVNSEPGVVDGKPVYLNTIKVPLRDADGKVWGVLGFVRDVTERETVLAEIQQSRAEAEARLRETRILQQLAQALSGTLEASEVIEAFFTASRELLGADYAIFSLVDPQQKRIGAVAGFNVSEDHIRRANHPLDSSDIMADIIRSGQTEIISGWDSRFNSENFDMEGMAEWGMRIFSPITLRHENVGMVEVGFKRKAEVTVQETQVRLLRSLVDQTAIAMESTQRYQASQKMAQQEQTIRQITEKMRQAPNLDLLAKVVAEELGKTLGVSHSLVRVGAGVGSASVTSSNGKNGNGSEQADQGVEDA